MIQVKAMTKDVRERLTAREDVVPKQMPSREAVLRTRAKWSARGSKSSGANSSQPKLGIVMPHGWITPDDLDQQQEQPDSHSEDITFSGNPYLMSDEEFGRDVDETAGGDNWDEAGDPSVAGNDEGYVGGNDEGYVGGNDEGSGGGSQWHRERRYSSGYGASSASGYNSAGASSASGYNSEKGKGKSKDSKGKSKGKKGCKYAHGVGAYTNEAGQPKYRGSKTRGGQKEQLKRKAFAGEAHVAASLARYMSFREESEDVDKLANAYGWGQLTEFDSVRRSVGNP